MFKVIDLKNEYIYIKKTDLVGLIENDLDCKRKINFDNYINKKCARRSY